MPTIRCHDVAADTQLRRCQLCPTPDIGACGRHFSEKVANAIALRVHPFNIRLFFFIPRIIVHNNIKLTLSPYRCPGRAEPRTEVARNARSTCAGVPLREL